MSKINEEVELYCGRKTKKQNSKELNEIKRILTSFSLEDNLTKTYVILSSKYDEQNRLFKYARLVEVPKKYIGKYRGTVKSFKKDKMKVIFEYRFKTRNGPIKEKDELYYFKEKIEEIIGYKLD